ncbi:MAG: beta-lactamase family protein [Anaerolineales bacterium]|nr:beta-lactamase family protein [Anaerolineales bacterium]
MEKSETRMPKENRDPAGFGPGLPDSPLPAKVISGQSKTDWCVEDRMERFHVPAVSAAVVRDMEIAWSQAWGVLEEGGAAQATPCSLFQTASISKFVTAVGALHLVREGLLSLDEDVKTYLEAWHLPRGGHRGEVTLRRLLSHSAGVSTLGFEGYGMDDELPDLRQVLEGAEIVNSPPVKVIKPPGEGFRYSGGGYLVVQKVIEEVMGEPFPEVMRERVFSPLGMQNSIYAPLDPEFEGRAASGHSNGQPIPGKGPIHVESGAGGLWSTPSDLLRLTLDIMRAYHGEEGEVLSPDLVQAMLETHFWDFGLGVRVLGEGLNLRFNHGGATRGWQGQVIAYPERRESIAVLTNGANGYVVWPEVERGIASFLGWPGWEPEVVTPVRLDRGDLEAYQGTYEMPGVKLELGWKSVEDHPWDPILRIEYEFEDLIMSAVPTERDLFELLEFEGQVIFARNQEGAVEGLELWFGLPDWSPYRRWNFEKT